MRGYARVRAYTNCFDSAQFILKELFYMNDRPINGKLIPNGKC